MISASNKTGYIEKLFEQIFALIQQENDLLDKDDIDALSLLTSQRAQLLTEAWDLRDDCDAAVLRNLLLKAQQLQDALTGRAQQQYDDIREQLATRKKQSGYFANAQKRAAYTDKAFYMNKIS